MTAPTCATCRWWRVYRVDRIGLPLMHVRTCDNSRSPLWSYATAHTETCGEHATKEAL